MKVKYSDQILFGNMAVEGDGNNVETMLITSLPTLDVGDAYAPRRFHIRTAELQGIAAEAGFQAIQYGMTSSSETVRLFREEYYVTLGKIATMFYSVRGVLPTLASYGVYNQYWPCLVDFKNRTMDSPSSQSDGLVLTSRDFAAYKLNILCRADHCSATPIELLWCLEYDIVSLSTQEQAVMCQTVTL